MRSCDECWPNNPRSSFTSVQILSKLWTKLPDKLELIARVRYHSQAYVDLLERNAAFAALEVSEKRMAHEMETGARYVASLMPAPIETPIRIDWRFIPSAELGGDSLGYFPLDAQRFAFFLLDEFEQQEIVVPPDSRLLLFSDGAFEIHKQDGGMWTFREFMQFVSQPDDTDDCILDRLIRYVRTLKGGAVLDDDFSIMDLKI